MTRFSTRVTLYAALLDDRYPVDRRGPGAAPGHPRSRHAHHLDRFLALLKWLPALHYSIVLAYLILALAVCVVVVWSPSCRSPRGLFGFVVGVVRRSVR